MKLKHTRLKGVEWSPYNGQATWNQTRLDLLDSILTEILGRYPRMYTGSYTPLIWPIMRNINWVTYQTRGFIEFDIESVL
jgi:hypothetical protein